MALCRTRNCRFMMGEDGRRMRKCVLLLYQPCHLSTNSKPKSMLSLIASKAKYANEKYEHFLERKFPNFYLLYSTFMKGFRMLMTEAKEVGRIKQRMNHQGIPFHQLPYREMEKLRQFRRDIIKAAPVVIISIPPFANYLVFVLMYFFPRQLLIRHFWTPKQREEFLDIYHRMRVEAYPEILDGLLNAVPKLSERNLRNQMFQLCTQVQHGTHPQVENLHAVCTAFSGPPLGMKRLDVQQMKALSRVMFLTPHLPAFLLQHRLGSHICEIQNLDCALLKLGVNELSEEELKRACYIRGLNSTHLSREDCETWLHCWLQLSSMLKVSEASLLLHCMVLLSANYLQSIKQ
ncbi:LETM1 domain-containing protein 1 [Xenopus tropicalis]|nr:LETM1 domain-containing protein 1 [Xenopus tropicalis]AAI70792.1 LETM1 domain containing 1 [Xenopus tropicalis]AAI70794.1 LETM1 domain containing 1 [Xenopus tropicalis]|eukprot:NP_001016022.1 LETM1 domain-containing protein 1 [Xenopus tropicalis]